MTPEYTPAVHRALGSAQRWAHFLGADTVQPPHLLLGLLEEEEGRVATLLTGAGLDLGAARRFLGGSTPAPATPAGAVLPAFSPESNIFLREARTFLGSL